MVALTTRGGWVVIKENEWRFTYRFESSQERIVQKLKEIVAQKNMAR